MDAHAALRLKFWGVRGSIASPSPTHMGVGGNTACLELRSPEGTIVIDAGTGVRGLGGRLQAESNGAKLQLHFLFTHFHWDHIQGLPSFAPLFSPETDIVFHSSLAPEHLKKVLQGQMSSPYYPIDLGDTPARKTFSDITQQGFQQCGMSVLPFPLHHPDGATGYRIESGGTVIVHASDFEHGDKSLDRKLREHAQNADILIYDAQYTPEEYDSHKGWGHSTWMEAARVARDCNVKRLVLFHHDPNHDDESMDAILREARSQFENTDIAREGWEITF